MMQIGFSGSESFIIGYEKILQVSAAVLGKNVVRTYGCCQLFLSETLMLQET